MKIMVVLLGCFLALNSLATVYEVGDGKTYETIGAVPWVDITAGDTVLIYYKDDPYKEKFVVSMQGTIANPVIIRGVPGPNGALPVLDGNNAVAPKTVNYWKGERSVITVGGSTIPNYDAPANLFIENLDIKSARTPYMFTEYNGKKIAYSWFAACIDIAAGENITIRNCIIRDSGNGIVSSKMVKNLVIEGCYIYDNGLPDLPVHNTYTESQGITYQYNRFGPVKDNASGNGLKDRSSGCVVRYNWIEGGSYRLSLVDSDYAIVRDDPRYRDTWLYGNVIVDSGQGAGLMMRYGGDMGDSSHYRKGTLHCYNNTFIWDKDRIGHVNLFRLETDEEFCDFKNNIIYCPNISIENCLDDEFGKMNYSYNISNTKILKSHSVGHGKLSNANAATYIIDGGNNIEMANLGFKNEAIQDFSITKESQAIDKGGVIGITLDSEYSKHQSYQARPQDKTMDIGAFEYQFPVSE